uniref:Uncharacterized protein n=1 Tax=Oryza brachyantha TaxID=4533 RepID=J3MI60_ORYBR
MAAREERRLWLRRRQVGPADMNGRGTRRDGDERERERERESQPLAAAAVAVDVAGRPRVP